MSPDTINEPGVDVTSRSNADLTARSLKAVWHPCTQMKAHEAFPLVPIVAGEGVWLIDADGHRYIDAVSSWWVNLFGHREPRISAAVRDQLDRLEHVILAGFTHEPVVQLSERLSALTGGALGHAFYASDGASATEIALKMSAHFWHNQGRPGKNRFIALEGGYHGETLGALGVTDVPIFRTAYEALLRPAATLPSPDSRRAARGEKAIDVAIDAATALERYLERHASETAAIIFEPLIQCAGGMAMHGPEYLRRVRALCDRFDVHFIADEIAVGFGRTGTLFAHEQAGIRPDFLCLSKGITGGYLPLSVVLTTDAVFDAFYDHDIARAFLHSHSYTGNPLACAAALAVLEIFEQDNVIETNRDKAARFDRIAAPLGADPRVRHARRTGMVWAFDVPDAPIGFPRTFAEVARREGALLRPIGNTVYLMPPYVMDDETWERVVRAAQRALDASFA
ncbi:MAG: adenosylmethionine--8-amino-7-oxononanoate transaminase [Burkholderiales bacterium]|nr:adenosylmethionine--8-amino-7-oxononanoate transaminase [Burkholderiales bacterium]